MYIVRTCLVAFNWYVPYPLLLARTCSRKEIFILFLHQIIAGAGAELFDHHHAGGSEEVPAGRGHRPRDRASGP
jgi:hypothetical protein